MMLPCKAQDFTTAAVMPNGQIEDHYHLFQAIDNRYAVLFFYPLNFTFVCPTEMIALHRAMPAFKAKQVEVVTVSVDSHFSHLKWRQTPIDQGGIGAVDYIMASDVSHQICQSYGVSHPDQHVALRATVLIDKQKQVRHMAINDLPLGRNIDEIVRLVDACQHADTHGEVCPVGWQHGQQAMQANDQSMKQYLQQHLLEEV